MPIQLFPENIRRFVGELSIGKPADTAERMDPIRLEPENPPIPADNFFQAFLDFPTDERKGVEMCSAVPIWAVEFHEIHPKEHQNNPYVL